MKSLWRLLLDGLRNLWDVIAKAGSEDPAEEVEVLARIEKNLADAPLSGLVAETMGGLAHEPLDNALEIAAMGGIPVVRVSRGDEAILINTNPTNLAIEGNNLSPVKARLLLMASLMKFDVSSFSSSSKQ